MTRMRNIQNWQPTKFEKYRGSWRGSRNPQYLAPWSRLSADLVSNVYSEWIPKYCSGHLLDLGCGHVPLYGMYCDYVDRVVCVDWPNSIHQNEFLDFECDITERLPLPDSEFDTIILSDVLEHLSDPEFIWVEMARLLKPSGIALLNVPFLYGLHEEPFDFYRYTRFALQLFAERTGFEVVQLCEIGGAPTVLADILAKTLRRLRPGGHQAAIWTQIAAARFGRTRFGRKVSDATIEAFPLAYAMAARRL